MRDRRDGAEQAEPPYFTSESANSNKKALTLSEGKFLMHISLTITSNILALLEVLETLKTLFIKLLKHFIKCQSM